MATIGSINQSLYTGVSGLQEVQTLLNTTSRNIVNAQTPGYVVKNEQAVSNAATGGVLAGPITRFINASLQQKARTNDADTAFAQARATALTQMDQLSGNPADGTSISAQINQLQTDFQELAANPQAAGNAENILNDANNLAQTFNEQTNAMLGLQRTANTNVVDDVAQVNADLQNIAELNKKVVAATANGQDPTDLEDQRDIAVDGLSKLMGVNAFIDNQGVLQVLSSDFKPLAGLYAETVTYNQVNNTVSVSGQQINNVNGDIGGNLQVLTGDTVKRLQNLSEVATKLTEGFQELTTSTIALNGTIQSPPPAATPDIAIPGTVTLITNAGNQYTATMAYRPPAVAGNAYQLVISSLTPVASPPAPSVAPAVTVPAYVAATNTGGLVIGTVDVTTNPPTFAGQQVQLTPTVAGQVPGDVEALTGYTTGLSVTAGATTPTASSVNNTMTLFTTMSGALPPFPGPFTPPYYSGTIELNPNISLRALAVGDQFAGTTPDSNGGAAAAAAAMLNNRQFAFTTTGIAGTATLGTASAGVTVGIGQDLANTNNSITGLTTAATQIQQAIAPQSEVNLDQQMSQLVVLQNAYSANARVVTTVNSMLDTLVNLVP